ncbi:MAG: transferrin-binding protein-like solute binding protein [Nitrosomonadales bacterium]|nr:transferrin-binding protein-like solute binding protein [Nitrosomonadales bacterium]
MNKLNKTISAAGVAISTLLLSGCLAGSGSSASVVASTPVVPPVAPVTPVSPVIPASPAAQLAANTLVALDSAGLSVTETKNALGTASFITGPGVLLAATTLTIPQTIVVAPVLPAMASATFTGGINTSVAALAANPAVAGAYTGAALNGKSFSINSQQSNVLATLASPQAGLTYADFGDWQLSSNIPAGASGLVTMASWAGGTQVTQTMPVVGNATYAGVTSASSLTTVGGGTSLYQLSGNISLTANFASGTIAGNITNISAVNNAGAAPVAAGAFNNVTLSGTISGNAFNGTTTAGALPVGVNPASIAAGTTGTVAGHFYGPTANEVSGVWGMATSTVQAQGSFGAKK